MSNILWYLELYFYSFHLIWHWVLTFEPYLNRDDRLGLFSECDAAVKKWWNNVVNQQMNSRLVIILKILIKISPDNHTAPHHSVGLP